MMKRGMRKLGINQLLSISGSKETGIRGALKGRVKNSREEKSNGKSGAGKTRKGKERKGRHERQRRHLSRGNEGWRERERGGACRPLNERKPKEAWMWRGKG